MVKCKPTLDAKNDHPENNFCQQRKIRFRL